MSAASAKTQNSIHMPRGYLYVLLVACLILTATTGVFVAGAVTFVIRNGPTMKVPDSLLDDTTFFILCSQVFPIILNGIYELVKAFDDPQSRWRSPWLFFCVTVFVMALSLAAPIVYGVADRTNTWTQVQSMILSMAASVGTIFAGIVSVFEAGRTKSQRDDLENQLVDRETQLVDLEKQLVDLEKQRDDLKKQRDDLKHQSMESIKYAEFQQRKSDKKWYNRLNPRRRLQKSRDARVEKRRG